MPLFSEDVRARLLANGACAGEDHFPVVKLIVPFTEAIWLLTELDPDDPDIAFGLCDLGLGFPELGSVSLSELESLSGPLGIAVERDAAFRARFPLSVYAEAARRNSCIVEAPQILAEVATAMRVNRPDGEA